MATELLLGAVLGIGFAVMRTSGTSGGPLPGTEALVLVYLLIAFLAIAGMFGLVFGKNKRIAAGLLVVAVATGATFAIAQELIW